MVPLSPLYLIVFENFHLYLRTALFPKNHGIQSKVWDGFSEISSQIFFENGLSWILLSD